MSIQKISKYDYLLRLFLSFRMEHLGNQTTDCHAFYILLFLKVCQNNQVPFKSVRQIAQFL